MILNSKKLRTMFVKLLKKHLPLLNNKWNNYKINKTNNKKPHNKKLLNKKLLKLNKEKLQ